MSKRELATAFAAGLVVGVGATVAVGAIAWNSRAGAPRELLHTKPDADNHSSESIPECGTVCAGGSFCMNTEKGPRCISAAPAGSMPELSLPFDAATEVACTHSSGLGSHSWANAFFALDLANSYDDPAAVVHASADGTAYVFLGEDGEPCPEPPGTPRHAESTRCGQGWGNRVKIHHGGGVVSFYVHLESVLVKTGDAVVRGQPIGIEGWTGSAGHRHLHWSVQRIPGHTLEEWVAHMDWSGDSLPFRFRARVEGQSKIVDASNLQCRHVGFGEAPRSEQPLFSGAD